MSESTAYSLNVPDQLSPLIDENFLEVHQAWSAAKLEDLENAMPEPVTTEYGRAVVLEPKGDIDESRTLVLGLPHQQAWKPSMLIRAGFLWDTVAPDSRMIVLPNNTVGDTYYDFDDQETETLNKGDMSPFYNNRLRVLEALDVRGRVDLTGYSLGALTAMGVAKAGHKAGLFEVGIVNADEAPNKSRDPKQLQKDFMKSGGWGDQRNAIADAWLPVLDEALSVPLLAADYVRFGAAALSSRANKSLSNAMAGNYDLENVFSYMRDNMPDTTIKVGRVHGSRVSDAATHSAGAQRESRMGSNIEYTTYSGAHTHLHPTGDNPVAHALMFKDAQERAEAWADAQAQA